MGAREKIEKETKHYIYHTKPTFSVTKFSAKAHTVGWGERRFRDFRKNALVYA